MKIVVAVLVACVVAAEAGCPNLSLVQNFDVSKFAGTWYSQKQLIGNTLFQGVGSCVKAQYTLNSTTGVVTVLNSEKNVLGLYQQIDGTAVLADSTKTEGKLNVTLNTAVGKQTAVLNCLDTDYDNFVILYSCQEVLGRSFQSGWIMTRTRVLKGEEKVKVEGLIRDSFTVIEDQGGPSLSSFRVVRQDNC